MNELKLRLNHALETIDSLPDFWSLERDAALAEVAICLGEIASELGIVL